MIAHTAPPPVVRGATATAVPNSVAVPPCRVAMRWLKGLVYLPAALLFAAVLAEVGVRVLYPAGAVLIADALAQTARSKPFWSTFLGAVGGEFKTTAGRHEGDQRSLQIQ